MELKPRPVEVDQFLELDEHLLNRNGVTPVTAASQRGKTSAGQDSFVQSSDAGASYSSGTTAQGAVSKHGNSEQQQIVRIVIS